MKDARTLAELAEHFDAHPNQIQDWKKQLLSKAEHIFGASLVAAADYEQAQKKLHAKIEPLTMEKDFLANAIGPGR